MSHDKNIKKANNVFVIIKLYPGTMTHYIPLPTRGLAFIMGQINTSGYYPQKRGYLSRYSARL